VFGCYLAVAWTVQSVQGLLKQPDGGSGSGSPMQS
jgi:hypothetical protein